MEQVQEIRRCRVCGCTDDDCRQCIAKTGHPCHWVAEDLCSACADEDEGFYPDLYDDDGELYPDEGLEEDEDLYDDDEEFDDEDLDYSDEFDDEEDPDEDYD